MRVWFMRGFGCRGDDFFAGVQSDVAFSFHRKAGGIPLVAIVRFRDGKLAHEHIYWDQASLLVQLGLLDPSNLPVEGVACARKAQDKPYLESLD